MDPGLALTPHRDTRGPYVGRAHGERPIARFSTEADLERILQALQAGFGPQRWWPAQTPFEVMVGALLTQNTAWHNVELALDALRRRGELAPRQLLALGSEELAERIRSSGTFRIKAQRLQALARWYLDQGGLAAMCKAPSNALRDSLLEVHGVGPETADSILCYALGRPVVVVDAYTRRLLARHGLVRGDEAYDALRAWLQQRLLPEQAVLEEFHALCVRVGYNHCKPKARCASCPAPTPLTLPASPHA